jgi:hypothetical protein
MLRKESPFNRYPDTVADGYLEYQIYDSIQGLCSYLRGVVSTSAVLMAAGVGDAEVCCRLPFPVTMLRFVNPLSSFRDARLPP